MCWCLFGAFVTESELELLGSNADVEARYRTMSLLLAPLLGLVGCRDVGGRTVQKLFLLDWSYYYGLAMCIIWK